MRLNVHNRSFTDFEWGDLKFEVAESSVCIYPAYVQGNKVVLSRNLVLAPITGKISIDSFLFILAHEIAHVFQQANLFTFLSPKAISNYIEIHRIRLEREADLFAWEILEKGFLGQLLNWQTSNKSSLCLYSDVSAPVQGWSVDGTLSEVMQAEIFGKPIKEREKIWKKMIPQADVKIMQLVVSPASEGVHEVFTQDGIDLAKRAMTEKISKDKVDSIVHGSEFNDRGHLGNVGFASQYAGKSNEYINQSHHGTMQFLHSMASSEGDYQLDRHKILRWIEFCVDVFYNVTVKINNQEKHIREVTFGEYFDVLPHTDCFLCMIADMLIDRTELKLFDKNYEDSEVESVLDRQVSRALVLMEHAKKKNQIYELNNGTSDGFIILGDGAERVDITQKAFSDYYGMTIGDFFRERGCESQDPGYVALGTACHVIQDSFAPSHARRVYDLFYKNPDRKFTYFKEKVFGKDVDIENPDVQGAQLDEMPYEEDIHYIYRYDFSKDLRDFRGDKNQKIFRDYLARRAMPILLFADYSYQSSGRHAHGDVWLKEKNLRYLTNEQWKKYVYESTMNACQARDCTAAFLYMVFTGKSKKEILDFVKQLYPLIEVNNHFAPTKGGLQYENYEDVYKTNDFYKDKFPGWLERKASNEYEDFTEVAMAYNVIEEDSENRLHVLYKCIRLLDNIFSNKSYDGCRDLYIPHLNEIAMELYGMTLKLEERRKNKPQVKYNSYISLLLRVVDNAEKLYKKIGSEANPFLEEIRKFPIVKFG